MNNSPGFHPNYLGEVARRLNLSPYPNTRQFVVQHLFPDTVRLLKTLHQYVPIDMVVGISYSGNEESVAQLRALGIDVHTPTYEDLESVITRSLKSAIGRAKEQGQKLIIHEVGGFAIKALHEPSYIGEDVVIGALEITKQGVWVAQRLSKLRIPQFNVAQTRLKQIEGKLVGEAVVSALDGIMRELGYAFVGRPALVCGYGWVGKGVARSLQHKGMGVSVKDTDVVSLVEACVDGFLVERADTLGQSPAVVIGATGFCSIDSNVLDQLPDRCILVSGASKDHEIDLAYLRSNSKSTLAVHPHVTEHTLDDNRRMYLVNKGFPVNFTGASVPDEIVEFLFAECIMLVPLMLDSHWEPGIYTLPPEQEDMPATVWLDLR